MMSQNQHDDDVIKHLCQFINIFTHCIPLPIFVVIWLEIATLGGAIPSHKWVLGWQKAQSR